MIKFCERRFYSCSGSPIRTVFKLGFSRETGAEELRPVGKENWDAMIQASADSCDLKKIISRVRNGEVNLLNVHQCMYGDFTEIPLTLQELMQTRIDAERMYNGLSDEVKKDLSFEDFMSQAGTLDWVKKLGYKVDDVKEDSDVFSES